MTHPFPCSTHRQPRKNKGQDHFASCKGSFVKGEWKLRYLILSLSVVSNVFSNVLGTFICSHKLAGCLYGDLRLRI